MRPRFGSRTFERWASYRALADARAAHGEHHPATHAAYARAFYAWGGRIEVPAIVRLTRPWRVVALRSEAAGYDNRAARRAVRAARRLLARAA